MTNGSNPPPTTITIRQWKAKESVRTIMWSTICVTIGRIRPRHFVKGVSSVWNLHSWASLLNSEAIAKANFDTISISCFVLFNFLFFFPYSGGAQRQVHFVKVVCAVRRSYLARSRTPPSIMHYARIAEWPGMMMMVQLTLGGADERS